MGRAPPQEEPMLVRSVVVDAASEELDLTPCRFGKCLVIKRRLKVRSQRIVIRPRQEVRVRLIERIDHPALGDDVAGERRANDVGGPRWIGADRDRIVYLIARIYVQQSREIAVTRGHGWNRIVYADVRLIRDRPGLHTEIEEEEKFVPSIDDLRDVDRAAQSGIECVGMPGRLYRPRG